MQAYCNSTKYSDVAQEMFLGVHRINFDSSELPIGRQQKGEIIALSGDNLRSLTNTTSAP
jgi:hypothetical protein